MLALLSCDVPRFSICSRECLANGGLAAGAIGNIKLPAGAEIYVTTIPTIASLPTSVFFLSINPKFTERSRVAYKTPDGALGMSL